MAVAALAAFVVAIAVSAPAYVDASETAMIRNEISHASVDEQSISGSFVVLRDSGSTSFQTSGVTAATAPFLDTYFGTYLNTMVVQDSVDPTLRTMVPILAYRQDQCGHVVLVSGRCRRPAGKS